MEENDGKMSKLLYYVFNLIILYLIMEYKYIKVYIKVCILNNSVYVVIKVRIYKLYIWSLWMKSYVFIFCEYDFCLEMIVKGFFVLCYFL